MGVPSVNSQESVVSSVKVRTIDNNDSEFGSCRRRYADGIFWKVVFSFCLLLLCLSVIKIQLKFTDAESRQFGAKADDFVVQQVKNWPDKLRCMKQENVNALFGYFPCMKVTAMREFEPMRLNTVLLILSFPRPCNFKVSTLERNDEESVAGIHSFFKICVKYDAEAVPVSLSVSRVRREKPRGQGQDVRRCFRFPILAAQSVSLERRGKPPDPPDESRDARQRFFVPVSSKERAKLAMFGIHFSWHSFQRPPRPPDEAHSVIPVSNDWSDVVILRLRARCFYLELPPSRPPDIGGCNSCYFPSHILYYLPNFQDFSPQSLSNVFDDFLMLLSCARGGACLDGGGGEMDGGGGDCDGHDDGG